ncbi:MAG: ribosome small subunit-dependent GTPase A [Planctomycetes bacterium]|nr:ribosome small subunit-dependent GTPase A [Planctomycetota bacterium]
MSDLVEGRVVRVDAKVCHVELGDEVLLAAPRGALFEGLAGVKNPIAVGDQVRLDPRSDPLALVEVLPRRNWLSRVASSHDPREQVLAANVDQLLVFASVAHPKFSSNRTDRILAACQWHGIPAVLVLNKIDLDKKGLTAELRATYESVPVPILETCAVDGRGLDELKELLRDKVTVLYGPSGAGKSTTLNAIQPGLGLKVGKISRHWEQGRHTTTHSRLIPLEQGGWVIDTPGIRVFRLHGVKKDQIRDLFPEFVRVQGRCKYPNCTHDHEPECAVLDALEEGAIANTRYMSYLEMLVEAAPDDFAYDDEEDEEDDALE